MDGHTLGDLNLGSMLQNTIYSTLNSGRRLCDEPTEWLHAEEATILFGSSPNASTREMGTR